jgi:hypothetical protein
MRRWEEVLVYLAGIGLFLSSLPASAQLAVGSGVEPNSTAEPVTAQQRAGLDELPDSPGANRSEPGEQENQQNNFKAQSGQLGPAPPQTAEPRQPLQSQSQSSLPAPQKPVGTAAAGASTVSGVAASQPAGVAVAPAKQRRARTIVLRVGAIVGACAAVGTVVALTQATPSKPPGAR